MLPAAQQTALDERLHALAEPSDGGWLGQARSAAKERLLAIGLPTRRDEYWRYTNPRALTQPVPDVSGAGADLTVFDAANAIVIEVAGDVITLPDSLPHGLEVSTLRQAAEADIHWVRDYYATLEAKGSSPVQRPLAALNSAYATDGILLRATGAVDEPVLIRNTQEGDPILHHVIKVEGGASLTVLEVGAPGARSNQVTEVEIADAAALHHIRIQGPEADRHDATHLFARLGAESVLKSFTLSANGKLARNEAVIELTGDDASATVAGAAFGRGAFHHDDTVFVTHDAENCESRQVFKKVLRDGATGVFQGKILVKEGAQKTDGYQISQSLLLDDDSVFLAKPELEIYADDVACSHGSTTGAIDETALFYLRSRGVPHREATDLLVLSFLAEALEEIEDEDLRETVSDLMADWLSRA
ncbi:Fe-S cluster assembly protein SufD [Jannaschia sp. 2305UL9-9]|uniref:Fe-S cluster assembly protein SufD n=1 Tax=Jannaschia sp. 2305UL9-9 TaxID=3121638 RepID=UPI0035276B8C